MGFAAGDLRQDMSSHTNDWTDDDPTIELGGPAPARAAPVDDAAADGAAAPADPRPRASQERLIRGDVLRGRYRVEEAIGTGGRSIVYRARDLRCEADDSAGAFVAIKVLKPEVAGSESALANLKSEFRCLRALSHPGIVRVFDLDRDGAHWFLVMELLSGQSLAAILQAPATNVGTGAHRLNVILASAEALAAAHEFGVIHGDIKPANVIVTAAGDVRLIDFGTASVSGQGDAADALGGLHLATPAYASPQVLSGARAEVTDDLFSLACVACEWLTGRHPFERADPLEAQRRGLTPAGLGMLDAGIAAALERGLAWDREQRPATVREWLRMLRDGAARPSDGLTTATTAQPAQPVQPVQQAQLVQSLQPVQLAQPVQLVQPVQQAQPAPPAQPAKRSLPPATLWIAASALLAVALLAVWLLRTPEPAPPAVAQQEARPTATLAPPTPAAAIAPTGDDATLTSSPATAPEAANAPLAPSPAAPAVAAQRFTFAAETVSVSRAASAAALRLSRDGRPAGRATVSWRIVGGTARAGRDYAGPASGTLSFADGQSTSTLFVPLVGGAPGDTSFTVEIVGTSRGTGLGDIPRVRVNIRRLMSSSGGAVP